MIKKLLVILSLFFILPVNAAELENPLKESDYAFLYLYSNHCGYCKKFNPVYKKLASKYSKQCKFLKVDTYTPYGSNLARMYRVRYVPYVIIFNNKESKAGAVDSRCLIDYSCVEKALTEFIKL